MPMIAAHPRPMPLAANNGAWQSVHHNKKAPREALFCLKLGGVDGTRTRDPRRDRPVF